MFFCASSVMGFALRCFCFTFSNGPAVSSGAGCDAAASLVCGSGRGGSCKIHSLVVYASLDNDEVQAWDITKESESEPAEVKRSIPPAAAVMRQDSGKQSSGEMESGQQHCLASDQTPAQDKISLGYISGTSQAIRPKVHVSLGAQPSFVSTTICNNLTCTTRTWRAYLLCKVVAGRSPRVNCLADGQQGGPCRQWQHARRVNDRICNNPLRWRLLLRHWLLHMLQNGLLSLVALLLLLLPQLSQELRGQPVLLGLRRLLQWRRRQRLAALHVMLPGIEGGHVKGSGLQQRLRKLPRMLLLLLVKKLLVQLLLLQPCMLRLRGRQVLLLPIPQLWVECIHQLAPLLQSLHVQRILSSITECLTPHKRFYHSLSIYRYMTFTRIDCNLF